MLCTKEGQKLVKICLLLLPATAYKEASSAGVFPSTYYIQTT